MNNNEPDLYAYLREQCPDLEAAKKWIHQWATQWEQKLPWENEPWFTSRAMAGHLSNVLEGNDARSGYALGRFAYCSTKYGSELYEAAWTAETPNGCKLNDGPHPDSSRKPDANARDVRSSAGLGPGSVNFAEQ